MKPLSSQRVRSLGRDQSVPPAAILHEEIASGRWVPKIIIGGP